MRTETSQLQLQLISGPISDQEKAIILSNLDKTNGVIASMLNRSEGSIRNFLNKNGITRTPEQIGATKLFAGSKTRGVANGNYKRGNGNNPYFYKKKHYQKNRLKHRARRYVYQAKKKGIIVPKNICEECGAEGPTEFHHEDYLKVFDVKELCRSCHIIADAERQIREFEEKYGDPLLSDYVTRPERNQSKELSNVSN